MSSNVMSSNATMRLFKAMLISAVLMSYGCGDNRNGGQSAGSAIDVSAFTVTESNVVGAFHVERAFDKSTQPNSFWESTGFPNWLQIEFRDKQSKAVRKYSLATGEAPGRMPRDWKLQASNDGITWVDLDIQTNQTKWKPEEERNYAVAKASAYRYFRLYVMAGNDNVILRIYEIKLF